MLQRLPADAPPTFATLNPPRPPAADKTIRRLQLAHPSFSYSAHEAQQKLHTIQVGPTPSFSGASAAAHRVAALHSLLPNINASLLIDKDRCGLALVNELCAAATQGEGSLYYAGAWCGYGFHEDGLKAGMAAAVVLGARVPWQARATCPKIGLADSFFLGTFDRFARMAIQLGSLRLILPNGEERLYGSRQWQGPVSGELWSNGKPCTMCSLLEFPKTVAESFRKWWSHHCMPRTMSGSAQSCSLQYHQRSVGHDSCVRDGVLSIALSELSVLCR